MKNLFNYRADGRIEWVCEHGCGHTIAVPKGKEKEDAWWIHGCCGCCHGIDIEKLAKEARKEK